MRSQRLKQTTRFAEAVRVLPRPHAPTPTPAPFACYREHMTLLLGRLPQDDEELWQYIRVVWGITVPRYNVCKHHTSPFKALADAYFGRSPVSVWKASRGFGGKSTLMGVLALIEAATLGAQITILGGSAAQSQRVHEVTKELWHHEYAPRGLLKDEPTTFTTRLNNGAWIVALMASQKSVRGPHPQRLRLDEVDEMDLALFEAAQGQPMDARGLQSQTVISSTHQYPDGTMTELLKRANEKNWPVYEWCWRESVGTQEERGWLTQEMVERKKTEVSSRMWEVEYDLQEPSFDGRAIETKFVDAAYDPNIGVYVGDVNEYIVVEPYDPQGSYITGVDWAKEQDWTIMRTFRVDQHPWREVAFLRTGRKPWPEMVRDLDIRLETYGGICVHDATGIGNVVSDMIQYDKRKIRDVVLRGRERESVFMEYIAGIEQYGIISPRIQFPYSEHKYVTQKDLFGAGHPPDTFIAGALAWSLRRKSYTLNIHPANITREESPWKTA
jgi:hypothetical protein